MILSPRRPRARAGPGRHLWLAALAALLALLLTACGASGARGGGAVSGSPSATSSTGAGLTVRPCLGFYSGGDNPAVTLTNSSANVTGGARAGDVIELRLDDHHSWKLTGIKPTGSLTSLSSQGLLDSADGTCVWILRAVTPGDAVVTFTGTALCDPTQACPQYAILQTFTIHIS